MIADVEDSKCILQEFNKVDFWYKGNIIRKLLCRNCYIPEVGTVCQLKITKRIFFIYEHCFPVSYSRITRISHPSIHIYKNE